MTRASRQLPIIPLGAKLWKEIERERVGQLAAARPKQPPASTGYLLWLCVGYQVAGTDRRVVAIDVVSADSSDAAARALLTEPALAHLAIATVEVRLVANGRLDRAWRLLRYDTGGQLKDGAP